MSENVYFPGCTLMVNAYRAFIYQRAIGAGKRGGGQEGMGGWIEGGTALLHRTCETRRQPVVFLFFWGSGDVIDAKK